MDNKIQCSYFPGDKWLYYQVYIGLQNANKFLCQFLYPRIFTLSKEKLIKRWFFIRYSDPEHHLRIRFELLDLMCLGKVIQVMSECFNQPFCREAIWNIQINTYKPEIERYGRGTMELAEEVFFFDSEMIVSILKNPKFKTEDFEWKSGIYMTLLYLNLFYPKFDAKLDFIQRVRDAYANEFNLNKDSRIRLNEKYRSLRSEIENCVDNFIPIDGKSSDEPHSSLKEKLKKYQSIITDSDRESVLTSLIHMSLNRLFSNKNREQEFVCYDFILRACKSKLARGS
ncbi:thiopeptide-type bacteriocin biosynthesis protein [Flagellimonas onchidii]|uniref:thiopeptide-type bacteriocin biosynthesis protein n=1 Tax=Flagellimonas onchidii TaxID=2562684 RepID=UPI0010A67F45|nr:thiopeptide-type bacteriocin biosynthesis protein [Allomuricauda onchidii]